MCRMTWDDVDAVTMQHLDAAIINLALLGNDTDAMMRFCECSLGGANESSAHCHLVNDYNISLMELCNDQHVLQQHDVMQVYVRCFSVYFSWHQEMS